MRTVVLFVALGLVACVSPFERDGDVIDLATDAGLRDGEMEPIVAQEHCYRWICEGHRGETVRRSCGGLDAYVCH